MLVKILIPLVPLLTSLHLSFPESIALTVVWGKSSELLILSCDLLKFENLTYNQSKMAEKKKLGFFENFMLSGVAAGVSKTAAAPIERVKLLVQNQDEMIKQGRLSEPYKGVVDCVQKTLRSVGVIPFWRGKF